MTRSTGIALFLFIPFLALGQGGDAQVRAKADQLFTEQRFAEAMPLYSQLVSLTPSDRGLNYRLGACMLFGNADKEKSIGHLKFATEAPDTDPSAWYWMGRAYHLNYHFKEAQVAYQRFLGTADKKTLAAWPVEALQRQCRNGEKLLSSLKEITVRNKVEVADADFFRFYDLADIGGRIVVLPEELKTSIDKKRKHRGLVYLPERNGPIYFSSYGRDGETGLDIYRSEVLPDGTYAVPVKLAGYINTDQDEDFPFMHPDGKTFYFCSKGHNSMGGFDVFRAGFDKGLDAFGRPENLDFAVSTPDDDILYIVDAEQKEACFASGRNSKQGNLHVYRVGTAQAPVMITVFKGTYASTIDPDDRKARIVVEDVLSQEQVADVRTDMNGNFVLSVPRAGRYRYKVECGPTGKTHGGVVDVPKADGPRAYRQELVLDRRGDLEQLSIRNYFDDPLSEDMISLALDEIKRRARLDVSNREVVAEQPAPVEQATGDLLTRAGFTGDVDEVKAVSLAKEEARETEAEALDQQAMAAEAFALSLDAAQEAEKAAARADELVKQAAAAGDDEQRVNALMTEAAAQRQRARDAAMRARAAHNTGLALSTAALATRQKSIESARLVSNLSTAIATQKDQAALAHLRDLKQRLDARAKHDRSAEPAEQARLQLQELEKESARLMSMAKARRDEESELVDQLARAKRERADTRSRSKQEEIDRRITELEQQQRYLRAETEAAVNKATAAERQTAAMRGQASLTKHLSQTTDRAVGNELNAEQAQQLGLRISAADQKAAALPIDERFDAMIVVEQTQAEARAFDWDLVSAAQAIGQQPSGTRPMERSTQDEAQREASRRVDPPIGSAQDKETRTATIPADAAARTASSGSEAVSTTERDAQHEATRPAEPSTQGDARLEATRQGTLPAGSAAEKNTRSATTAVDGTNQSGNAAAQQEQQDAGSAGVSPGDAPANDRFMLENERAELQQLAEAERDRTKKAEIQQRISAIDQRIAALDTQPAPEEAEAETEADMSRPVLTFNSSDKEEEIIPRLYADYAADLKRAERLTDSDARADAINGIELMLADSIRAEMQRQVAVLQLAPQQAETVLPRVDRLRRMREEHIARGEQEIVKRQAEVTATATRPQTDPRAGSVSTSPSGPDPVEERYVSFDRYAGNVYASKVEHRSTAKGVNDAIAFREADVARITDLSTRIDSMEKQLAGMPLGRESDKLRKKADQLIDERYIIRTDLGQRSAFLTREEWKAANDSLKLAEAAAATRGLGMDEPILLMAREYATEARNRFKDAEQLRKRADRSEDIVLRDSLYRRAYRNELLALQAIDKSITAQNYLAGEEHQRGEQLTYAEVAQRVLGIEPVPAEEAIADRGTGADSSSTETAPANAVPEPSVGQATKASEPVAIQADAKEASTSSPDERAAAETRGQRSDEGSETAVEMQGQRADQGRETAAAPGMSTAAPAGSKEAAASTAGAASADQLIAAAEQKLSPKDRVPANLYERYMSAEQVTLSDAGTALDADPTTLAFRSQIKAQEAAGLESRSQEAADRATALADSALTARKRDREHLQAMAARERAVSDSLHAASVHVSGESTELHRLSEEAAAATKLRERLVRYYYLTPEEQRMAMLDGDGSRYIQAKALALEQMEAATDATASARSNRDVALVLRQQARAAERDAVNGRIPAAEATQKAIVLGARATQLELRADSLESVAARLRGAASINEAQAGVMLQAMPADRSSELMALEQRARRAEALLAESRDEAAPARDQASITLSEPPRAGLEQAVPDDPRITDAGAQRAVDADLKPATGISPPPAAQDSDAQPSASRPSTTQAAITLPSGPDSSAPVPFRMPDELVEDVFFLNEPTTRREAPIPIDAELPSGIVFKVQIGAFRKPVPQEAFSDMAPVMGETVGNGLVRYTAGLFTGAEGAMAAKDLVRERGYRDAFVVAYRDGKRIPLGEAMRAAPASDALASSPIRVRRASEEPRIAEQQPMAEPPTIVIKPVAPTQGAAPESDAQVLARYPATSQQILESFAPATDAASYYNEPGAAPAKQVETIKGLFFTVQVGVYSRPVPLDKLFNITPLNSERTESAKVRYTTGRFMDMDTARARKDEAVGLGVKDAFITAYLNGKRIPVREATALLQQFGPSILAQP